MGFRGIRGIGVLAGVAGLALTVGFGVTGSASATLVACTGSEVVEIENVGYTQCMIDTDYAPSDASELATITSVFGSGFALVGKDEDTDGISFSGGNTGDFAIDVALLDPTHDIAIIFKTGGGDNNPDDATFGLWAVADLDAGEIDPGDEFNGVYDISAWGGNGLSHFTVFSRACVDNCEPPCIVDCEPPCTVDCEPPCVPGQDPSCTPSVPEPGPVGLLGLGLVGLYGVRRRTNQS